MEDKKQIALRGVSRYTGRGPRSLGLHEDHGNFRFPGQAHGLGHQGKASSRCAYHGSIAGICPAQSHQGHCDLIFRLNGDYPQVFFVGGQKVQNPRGGRHGIGDIQVQTSLDSPQGQWPDYRSTGAGAPYPAG